MNFNNIKGLAIDPFISHMRISYEDGIRNQTEEYWRNKIAAEIRSYEINDDDSRVDIIFAKQSLKNALSNLVEKK
jgi:hypothetical protein